jgi:hypothetical protein
VIQTDPDVPDAVPAEREELPGGIRRFEIKALDRAIRSEDRCLRHTPAFELHEPAIQRFEIEHEPIFHFENLWIREIGDDEIQRCARTVGKKLNHWLGVRDENCSWRAIGA